MERFWNDLRFAGRQIPKQPAFSLFVVTILALDIGSTAATFTFIDGILLRSLSYKVPAVAGEHPTLGWGAVAAGGVEVIRVLGDHFSTLQAPYMETLAERL